MTEIRPKSGQQLRVLICGDRNWKDGQMICCLLSGLAFEWQHNGLVVIEGQAKGADQAAAFWCNAYRVDDKPGGCKVTHLPFPADWETHHKAAGPIRNKKMLTEGKPDVVYAFHDNIAESKGTKNMVEIATKAGVPCYVIGGNRRQQVLPVIEPVDVPLIRAELMAIQRESDELFEATSMLDP